MGKSRFRFATDTASAWETVYLRHRYAAEEADERRTRLHLTLKRLLRKGHDAGDIHRALLSGITRWHAHQDKRMRQDAAQKRATQIARARKDVERAAASLRALLPPGFPGRSIPDEVLLDMRHELLTPQGPSPAPGRPRADWRIATDEALRQLKVIEGDRRELLSALGFLEDE